MPLRCREGGRHPQPLHSTPGTPAFGDPALVWGQLPAAGVGAANPRGEGAAEDE